MNNQILIVGVGGTGARLASQAQNKLNAKCLLISNDEHDLKYPDCEGVFVDVKPLLNPSVSSIRESFMEAREYLLNKLSDSSNVIIIGNLAGRGGTGMAPLAAKMARKAGKHVVSFVTMPFKFETNKLFGAGVALRRMRESSNCLVIVDNDALLFNNPDLTVEDCYRITNTAVIEVIGSVASGLPLGEETNVLCTSKDSLNDAESALKDSIKMLYSDVEPDKVRRAMLYVIGGDQVKVGVLDSLVSTVQNILGQNGAEVGLSLSSSNTKSVRVLLMASVLEQTVFDAYDPLGSIPGDSVLDWEEIERGLKLETVLPQME